jgi:hypothetical protein
MTCKNHSAFKNGNTPQKATMRTCQKEFFVSARTRFLGRQDRINFHLESLCQNNQFSVRDTAKPRFDFGERATAQIPSKNRTAGGKHFLRHFLLITQLPDLRPDNVLRFCHAPKTELDCRDARELNCSNIGAKWQKPSQQPTLPEHQKFF